MSDIQVYNDYFDPNYFNHLKGVFTSQEFPWYYNDCVVDGNEEDFQFIHILYKNNQPASQFYNQLEHGIKLLNPYSLVRIKANLLTKQSSHIEHGMHVDLDGCNSNNLKTAILYVNSNNGYTLFEDGTKVESKENRLVIFPHYIHHTGASCTDEKVRIVVNFNYFDWQS